MELVQTLFQIAPKAISQKEQQAMQVEIQALQVRQAIVKVQPFMDQFTSRLFEIDSLLRLVINLKRLNCFTKNHHFKMKGIGKVKKLLRRWDGNALLFDLKNVYLSVPIARQHSNVCVEGNHIRVHLSAIQHTKNIHQVIETSHGLPTLSGTQNRR